MAEKSKTVSRHPVWEMTPVLIDTLQGLSAEGAPHWEAAYRASLSKQLRLDLDDVPLRGAEGLRAAYLLELADMVFEDEEEYHLGSRRARDRFVYCLGAKDIERRVRGARRVMMRHGYAFSRRQALVSQAIRWTSEPEAEYDEPRRPAGRPSGPSVGTVVRAWTIDALCELASLPLPEAIAVWNQHFPARCLNAEAQFRIERGRLRRWLGRERRRHSRGTQG